MIDLNPTVFAEGFLFLEAPKWRDGLLWVSDVFDRKVVAISPDGTRRVHELDVPHRPAGMGFLPDGRLIILSQEDQRMLAWDGSTLTEYADLSGVAVSYVNDMVVDAKGGIYWGDFGYDLVAGDPACPTSLYRYGPDGKNDTVATELEFPNGAVIIDEGRTLVVAETWVGRVTAFDIAQDGRLTNRRVFADMGERQPDGLCRDAEGAVWVACYNTGECLRILDGGEITHRLAIEGNGISCTLGGEDRKTLFFTAFLGTDADMAAGKRNSAVLSVRVDVPGVD